MFELRRVRQEQVVEQTRLDSIRGEVSRLEARRDSLMNDSATIERIARERYGMIRAGERLYRFADAPDSAAADSARRADAAAAAAGRGRLPGRAPGAPPGGDSLLAPR